MCRVRDGACQYRRTSQSELPRAGRGETPLRQAQGGLPQPPAGPRRYGLDVRSRIWRVAASLLIGVFWIGLAKRFFRVSHRRRDHVLSSCPPAQVNGAAMRAAEGELVVVALNDFVADRAVETDREFARHKTHHCSREGATRSPKIAGLHDLRYQVIVVSIGDLAAVELPGLRSGFSREVVDEDFPVDFRRMHGSAAFEQQLAFFRFALEQ